MFKNRSVLEPLLKSGWFIERKIDRNLITTILKLEGYPLLDKAINFLERFGNLVIYFRNIRNGLPDDDINFDIEHATNVENSERILESYKPRVGKDLCLIGSAYRGHFCLAMDSDGAVYGGYSDYLCKISNSGEGAIEAIILDYDFVEIT